MSSSSSGSYSYSYTGSYSYYSVSGGGGGGAAGKKATSASGSGAKDRSKARKEKKKGKAKKKEESRGKKRKREDVREAPVVQAAQVHVNDAVVYFKEGHRLHEELFAAEESTLPAEEIVRGWVSGIHLQAGANGQLIKRIAIRSQSGQTFAVSFDVHGGHPDFVIKSKAYDRCIKRKWKPGDKFDCAFDDQFYRGEVVQMIEGGTGWESLQVKWWAPDTETFDVNPDYQRISPWEVIDVSEEERRAQRKKTNAARKRAEKAAKKAAKKVAKELERAAQEQAALRARQQMLAAEEARIKREQEVAEAARKAMAERRAAEERRLAAEAALKAEEEARQKKEEEEREAAARLKRQQEAQRAQKEVQEMLAKQRAEREAARQAALAKEQQKWKWSVAVVCASNMNRSMEAHYQLKNKGMDVKSYGTGSQVKLPGPTKDQPNVYEYGEVTYADIHADLSSKDKELYTRNGLLNMLERNMSTKDMPQKFQEETEQFDIVFCFEERVFEAACEHISTIGNETMKPVHVINLDVRDNAEDAMIGAMDAWKLLTELQRVEDLESDAADALDAFMTETNKPVLYSLLFY